MGDHVEVISEVATELGPLRLQQREPERDPGRRITEVTLDDEFLMSSYLTASERALSEIALQLHEGHDLDVLIGGLGLGYTAHAALESPRVAYCEVVEFLPAVVDWMERGLVPLSAVLNADERLQVVEGDVYARLAAPPERTYDLVLIDVDHSPDENLGGPNAEFYTAAGLRKAGRHLADGGILGVWSYADSPAFVAALDEVFVDVHVEPVTAYNDLLGMHQTDWLFFSRGPR